MRAVDHDHSREVVLTDIDVPFLDLVGFMVKWALASIPAAIILAIMYFGAYFVLWRLVIAAMLHR